MTLTTTHQPATRQATSTAIAARAQAATKIYGTKGTKVTALDGVDIAFGEAEFTAIMGPSGSGKSTLMHCVAGLDRLTSGEIFLGETRLSDLSEKQLTRLRRDSIGFIFQAFNLLPTLTAKENIELPAKLAGTRPDRAWFDHVVTTVGLGERLGHKPNELSGGQQQRVAVARALASRPDIIFVDEPTGNLDSATGDEILRFMQQAVRELGQTIVMVTHDPAAAAFADRAVFLADGRIVGDQTTPTVESIHTTMRSLRSAGVR